MTQNSSGLSKFAVLGVIALLGIVGVFFALFVSRTSAVTTKVMQLKQAGMPTNGSELNAFYVVPKDATDTTKLWVSACAIVRTPDFMDKVGSLPILGSGADIPAFGQDWPQFEESKLAVEITFASELKLIRDAAISGGRVRFPVDFKQGLNTVLPDIQEMRTLARLLQLDANVAARDGDWQRVFDDILALFNASDALAEEPILISQLVRLAIRTLAVTEVQQLAPHGKFTDKQLQQLQEIILQANLRESLFRAYVGERAIGLPAIGEFAPLPFRSDNKLMALEIYERAILNHDKSWAEIKASHAETEDEIKGLSQGFISKLRYSASLMILPAMAQASEAVVRAEAIQRCAVLGLAALRQKLKEGTYPTGGSLPSIELMPEDPDLTTDPFTGEQILVASDDDTLTIYSVGSNETDDGGDVMTATGQSLDVGFQLQRNLSSH